MAAFRASESPPAWCELEHFDIVDLAPRERREFARRAAQERVLMTLGSAQAVMGRRSQVLREGQFVDFRADDDHWEFVARDNPCQLVRLCGRWGGELGGCGVFQAHANGTSQVKGDPVNYPKNTGIDSHYHDCDEYWVILDGVGTVVVGERHVRVTPGDCVPIGMGHHHDL